MTEKSFAQVSRDIYRELFDKLDGALYMKFVHRISRALQWAYNMGQLDEHKKHCSGCPQCREAS